MTDKQIIYNCPHISFTDWGTYACKLYDPRDKNCLVKGGNCDSNISCPYKQLKAKEQECEMLKLSEKSLTETIENIARGFEELEEQLKRKEQECEELKNFHINLVGVKECEIRELAKYKQAIKKIKDYCNKYPQNSIGFKQQILQICDEVNE